MKSSLCLLYIYSQRHRQISKKAKKMVKHLPIQTRFSKTLLHFRFSLFKFDALLMTLGNTSNISFGMSTAAIIAGLWVRISFTPALLQAFFSQQLKL